MAMGTAGDFHLRAMIVGRTKRKKNMSLTLTVYCILENCESRKFW